MEHSQNKTYRRSIDPNSKSGFRESLRCWLYSRVEEAKARAAEQGLSLARWELGIWEEGTDSQRR